jgi:hypothetical protein
MKQNQAILRHLRLNPAGLTPIEALQHYGIGRLAARVWELKKEGHPIETRDHLTTTGKHVARYVLEQPDALELGL